jgi:hypothetical protein
MLLGLPGLDRLPAPTQAHRHLPSNSLARRVCVCVLSGGRAKKEPTTVTVTAAALTWMGYALCSAGWGKLRFSSLVHAVGPIRLNAFAQVLSPPSRHESEAVDMVS